MSRSLAAAWSSRREFIGFRGLARIRSECGSRTGSNSVARESGSRRAVLTYSSNIGYPWGTATRYPRLVVGANTAYSVFS